MSPAKNGIKELFERWAPRPLFLLAYGTHAILKTCSHLYFRYGFLKTAYRWRSTNGKGQPIPWFTYPATEYLEQMELAGLSVFEYGSGNSTLYWARRGCAVRAVEDHAAWRDTVTAQIGHDEAVIFAPEETAYVNAIAHAENKHDIIVIDGNHRESCARAAVPSLRTGGIVILDDADEHAAAATLLRDAGLIEVDFAGFSPINSYTKTTSFFLHPAFRPRPRVPAMPDHSVGHPQGGWRS